MNRYEKERDHLKRGGGRGKGNRHHNKQTNNNRHDGGGGGGGGGGAPKLERDADPKVREEVFQELTDLLERSPNPAKARGQIKGQKLDGVMLWFEDDNEVSVLRAGATFWAAWTDVQPYLPFTFYMSEKPQKKRQILPVLLSLFVHPDDVVCEAAAWALGMNVFNSQVAPELAAAVLAGPPEVFPRCESMMKSDSPKMKDAALGILGKICAEGVHFDGIDKVLAMESVFKEQIPALLKNEDHTLRFQACYLLSQIAAIPEFCLNPDLCLRHLERLNWIVDSGLLPKCAPLLSRQYEQNPQVRGVAMHLFKSMLDHGVTSHLDYLLDECKILKPFLAFLEDHDRDEGILANVVQCVDDLTSLYEPADEEEANDEDRWQPPAELMDKLLFEEKLIDRLSRLLRHRDEEIARSAQAIHALCLRERKKRNDQRKATDHGPRKGTAALLPEKTSGIKRNRDGEDDEADGRAISSSSGAVGRLPFGPTPPVLPTTTRGFDSSSSSFGAPSPASTTTTVFGRGMFSFETATTSKVVPIPPQLPQEGGAVGDHRTLLAHEKHNPEKPQGSTVDTALKADAGREEEMFEALNAKDGQKLAGTNAPPINSGGGNYRARLVAFYEKHNPAKLGQVDKVLEVYAGREEVMFEALDSKYGLGGALLVQQGHQEQLVQVEESRRKKEA